MLTESDSNVPNPPVSRGIPKTNQSNVLTRLGDMHAPNVGLPKIADVAEYNYCSSCGTCEAICPVFIVYRICK